jgi:hypothetical protein
MNGPNKLECFTVASLLGLAKFNASLLGPLESQEKQGGF